MPNSSRSKALKVRSTRSFKAPEPKGEVVPIFRGRVKNGRVVVNNKAAFHDWIRLMEGEQFELVLRSREMRTNSQNRYYWGAVLKMLSDEWGVPERPLHEILKAKFLTPIQESSAALTVREFTIYLDHIIQFAAEHGILLPDSEDVD